MKVQLRQRRKLIGTGLVIIVLTIAGLIEYAQLVQAFDIPQMLLVIPLVGALAMILLGKLSFSVPVCTVLLACVYQILAGDSNAVVNLQTSAGSIALILMECLSVLLLFELLGMGGGALIRILIQKKGRLAVGVICCVIGIIVIVGPYLALFHNPLYPVLARHRLGAYAKEHFTDYPIADKKIYYSMKVSDYQCRVVMADGQIRVIYIGEDGEIRQQ